MSLTASKSITINAKPAKIWDAITDPKLVKQWMFGAEVVSDWQKGNALVYKGNWNGTPFEDYATIVDIEPEKLLKATYSKNNNTVTYELELLGEDQTKMTISQDNNPTQEEADKAAENWSMTLEAIKQLLEA